MFNHTALQCVFFFHHLSSQFAVVVVSFDLTGCCRVLEGRNVAWVSLVELQPF